MLAGWSRATIPSPACARRRSPANRSRAGFGCAAPPDRSWSLPGATPCRSRRTTMRYGCKSSPPPSAQPGRGGATRSACCPASAASASTSSTVDVDCGLRLAWADSRLAELTGYTIDELGAMGGFFALAAAADLPELHRRNQRLLVNQPGPIRYRLRRKSGELRLVQDHARAERAPGSDVVCRIVGTLADVSDSGWAAVPRAVLEREAALLGETLGACLARARHPGADPLGRGSAGSADGHDPRACRPEAGLAAARRFAGPVARLAGRGGGGAPAAALPPGLARRRRRDDAGGGAGPAGRRPRPGGGVAGRCRRRRRPRAWPPSTQGLLDALREPLLLVGQDRRIQEVNSAFERLVGSARTDLVGAAVVERLADARDPRAPGYGARGPRRWPRTRVAPGTRLRLARRGAGGRAVAARPWRRRRAASRRC